MYDAIIIGGGHNGLVTAAYLAKEGLRVAVFERRGIIGGAAATEELWPGIRVSTGSYVLSLLRRKIIEDLHLEKYGLKVYLKDPGLYVPFGNGKGISIWTDTRKTIKEIEKYSKNDAKSYEKFVQLLDTFSSVADFFMLNRPPKFSEVEELFSFFKGLSIDEDKALSLARMFFQDGKSFLDEFFESEEVKAALIEDAVVGTYASPSTPGTAYVFLHHNIGEVNGIKGAWGYVEGGMGTVSKAIAGAAKNLGVEVFTSSEVDEILTKKDSDGKERVVGVKLKNGKVVESRIVVSNADPKTTFLKLARNSELDDYFLRRVDALKTTGVSFKINGYLEELPDFGKGKSLTDEHKASILIMPSIDYIENAYLDSKLFGYSKKPWLSINIPSTIDPTLAPQGKFVFNIFGQYLPYSPKLDDLKDKMTEIVLETVREYAPNFKPVKMEFLTPLDIERRFGMWGGNIFHLDMTPDQLYVFRPLLGYSDYRTPIRNLYLCGSGTHPGGGVTGAPGYNAAVEILRDLKNLTMT
ncbi:MAG: NAD(P)/FAD-dependent oxidoreductase [Sulfolobaceae archaeon]